jgi:hypothetical protein
MAEAKIEIKVGGVSFTGEGSESWLTSQLDKLIKHLPDLISATSVPDDNAGSRGGATSGAPGGSASTGANAGGTLASFLNSKQATANQTRKFLATALFLQNGGAAHLTTNLITKALVDKRQGKLTNASQCLSDNIAQGFCEKSGKREFYVTDDGKTEIG